MAERFPGDRAAANGFGRHWLHDWEARLLQEANYPTPPDMCVLGAWRLSARGAPCLCPPARNTAIRANRSKHASSCVTRRTTTCSEQLASTNGAPAPGGRHNAEGRRQWWGASRRTLSVVLAPIEGGNEPPLEYPAPSFPRRRGSSWTPMRMDTPSSSSSGSRSSQSAPLLPVKPEPQETPLRRRTRGGTLVINEGGRVPSPLSSRLVKPKEPEALLPVEQEHEAMVADLESGLLWLCQDYVREEMERQHRALEEIVARRCGRDEGVVVMLSDNDNEVAAPSQPVRSGDPGQGCSKDAPKDGPPSVNDDDDSGDDYTAFYKLLGMNN